VKKEKNILTLTPIELILHHNMPIENSALAEKLIDAVREAVGVEIVCCYAQQTRQLSFENENEIKSADKFVKRYSNSIPPHFFTDNHTLNLNIKGGNSQVKLIDDENIKSRISQIYLELIKKEQIVIEYQRVFSRLELELYGFFNKPKDEWDMSKIIPVDSQPIEHVNVYIESFDSYMRWNILARCRNKISQQDTLRQYYAKAYVGWDKDVGEEIHYIVFDSEEMLNGFFSAGLNESIIPQLLDVVGQYDKYGIINIENYKPKFVLSSSLSNDKWFELLHG